MREGAPYQTVLYRRTHCATGENDVIDQQHRLAIQIDMNAGRVELWLPLGRPRSSRQSDAKEPNFRLFPLDLANFLGDPFGERNVPAMDTDDVKIFGPFVSITRAQCGSTSIHTHFVHNCRFDIHSILLTRRR